MYCPKCGKEARVIDSRNRKNGYRIRRYSCEKCGNRFSSIELTELTAESITAVYRMSKPFQFRKVIQAVYLKLFEPKMYKNMLERIERNENGNPKAK